jgi:hypothetical protein
LIDTVAGVWATRIPAERVGSRYKNWRESRRAGMTGHKLLKDWTETTEIDTRRYINHQWMDLGSILSLYH